MRVYLASAFQLRDAILKLREKLQSHDIEVFSEWLDVNMGGDDECSEAQKRELCLMDLCNVDKADYFVVFNPLSWQGKGTGGRHVETGYAIAKCKTIVYIGEKKENIFHWHPFVKAHIDDSIYRGLDDLGNCLVDVLVRLNNSYRPKVSDR